MRCSTFFREGKCGDESWREKSVKEIGEKQKKKQASQYNKDGECDQNLESLFHFWNPCLLQMADPCIVARQAHPKQKKTGAMIDISWQIKKL